MLKIQGRGYLIFFAKIARGVKAFRKNCLGPYFGFYCIFIKKCFEICLRWVIPTPPLYTPPLPCVHLWSAQTIIFKVVEKIPRKI
jgi:hypothetical protein